MTDERRPATGEHGRGSRYKTTARLKDGTTRKRIVVVMTIGGRRITRTVRTEREADKAQAELIRIRELELDPTRQTIADFLRGWLESRANSKRKPLRDRTLVSYTQLVEQRILPGLGHRTLLARLTRRRIQAWVDAAPGSPATVRNAYAVLRIALGTAVGESLPSNPAVGVELARSRYRAAPLTRQEQHALIEAAKGDRLEALWRLAMVTGLREGELLGLPRDALDGSWIKVDSQLQRVKGGWALRPPKSARTMERLFLDGGTVAIVKDHLRRMAEERQPSWRYHGLMFVTESGEPFHAKRIRTEFLRLCDRAGVAHRRFHDLRHSNNRLSKDLGIDQSVRMARHGHSTTEMDARYGGPSEEQDRMAAERYAEAIG